MSEKQEIPEGLKEKRFFIREGGEFQLFSRDYNEDGDFISVDDILSAFATEKAKWEKEKRNIRDYDNLIRERWTISYAEEMDTALAKIAELEKENKELKKIIDRRNLEIEFNSGLKQKLGVSEDE